MRRLIRARILLSFREEVSKGGSVFLADGHILLDRHMGGVGLNFETEIIASNILLLHSQESTQSLLAFFQFRLQFFDAKISQFTQHLVLLFDSVSVHPKVFAVFV